MKWSELSRVVKRPKNSDFENVDTLLTHKRCNNGDDTQAKFFDNNR
jgi:hypothetical protein